MKRTVVLTTLVTAGLLSIGLTAAQQQGRGGRGGGGRGGPPTADAIQVEKLADNLFVLRGGGGNTAAFIRADGVLLVDTKIAGCGQPIIDKLKTLTDKPVTTIVNTHAHYDHVDGNVEFPPSVDIVTHETTRTLMQQRNPVYGLQLDVGNPFKDSGGRGLPKRTFTDTMTLGSGAEAVELRYYGPAHTGGDTWVIFRTARVMHAGDVFPNKSAPIMDKNNGGSGVQYADTVARAAKTPGVDRVITGHSTVMTMAELAEYGEFNREFVRAVQEAKKAGRTPEDVAKTWQVPARFKGYTQPPADRLLSNAQVIWEQSK
jgi:glyoxylase-like metal-dependent hydrolase (beta-lactamase superfamily II)